MSIIEQTKSFAHIKLCRICSCGNPGIQIDSQCRSSLRLSRNEYPDWDITVQQLIEAVSGEKVSSILLLLFRNYFPNSFNFLKFYIERSQKTTFYLDIFVITAVYICNMHIV